MFTKEEAGTLLMAEKLMSKQADKSVNSNFSNAVLKIKNVLQQSEKDYLEILEDHVNVLAPKLPVDESFPNHFIVDIKIH